MRPVSPLELPDRTGIVCPNTVPFLLRSSTSSDESPSREFGDSCLKWHQDELGVSSAVRTGRPTESVTIDPGKVSTSLWRHSAWEWAKAPQQAVLR
ncbi:unnamed protein product, partial [Ilex paraguariensis]